MRLSITWCNKVKDRGWLASKLGTPKRSRNTKCWDCDTITHKQCLWIITQHRFNATKDCGPTRAVDGASAKKLVSKVL